MENNWPIHPHVVSSRLVCFNAQYAAASLFTVGIMTLDHC